MLARKYDNYAWQQPQREEEPKRRLAPRPQGDNHVALGRAIIVAVLLLSSYMAFVWRSETVIESGRQLIEMEQQEQQLVAKNNELKIEVEQLRGPERIIGLAEQQLGMSVARSNIYVKSAQTPKSDKTLAGQDK